MERGVVNEKPGGIASDVIAAFRLAAQKKASELVVHPDVADAQYRANNFPQVAALLTTALDFLRVAEERLAAAEAQRNSCEASLLAHAARQRELFQLAPAPLVVTTRSGLISEANREAVALLGREASLLDGLSLIDLVAESERAEFRHRLRRVTELGIDCATHWCFQLRRRRDNPLRVRAVMHGVPREGGDVSGGALFWTIHPDGKQESRNDSC
jgi:PAS domain S-box-containing protein